jgi:DNA repair protein RecO (recombination protein O)
VARPARFTKTATKRVSTRALVLRRTLIGDADIIALLFTETHGVVSATARGARRATSKLGALEPVHTLSVTLEMRPGKDIAKLVEARISEPRIRLLDASEPLEASFRALVWARGVLHPLEPEPAVFLCLVELFAALDAGERAPATLLAGAGLEMLTALGYRLELTSCVRCGRPCPDRAPAYIDPRAGGLVCRDCARTSTDGPRAGFRVSAKLRSDLLALQRGEQLVLDSGEQSTALELVEATFAAHPMRPPRT